MKDLPFISLSLGSQVDTQFVATQSHDCDKDIPLDSKSSKNRDTPLKDDWSPTWLVLEQRKGHYWDPNHVHPDCNYPQYFAITIHSKKFNLPASPSQQLQTMDKNERT